MRLFTIQPQSALQQLETTGRLFTLTELIEADWLQSTRCAYEWLSDKLANKTPKPIDCQYPLWGWYNKKAFIGHSFFNCRLKDQYLLEIEISKDKVLLSDYDKWHCVLSGIYLTDNNKYDRLQQEINRDGEFYNLWHGITEYDQDKYRHYAKKYEKMFDNWNNIFRINKNTWIQGVFWEIEFKQVVRHRRLS